MALLNYLHGSQAPVAAPATTETQPEVIQPVEAPETKDEAEADAPIAPAVVAAESTAEPVVEVGHRLSQARHH